MKCELEYLIKNYYTDLNIKRFQDSILEDFKRMRSGEILPSSHLMTKDDINEIFFNKEEIFCFKELRGSYLNFHK